MTLRASFVMLSAAATMAPARPQEIPLHAELEASYFDCPAIPYLPLPAVPIDGLELRDYWLTPEIKSLTLSIPEAIKDGSIVDVRFDFLVDSLGCPSGHRITESSGFPELDAQLLQLFAEFRYLPAEMNIERRAVVVTGHGFGFGVPGDKTRYGSLDGSMGDLRLELDGVYVYFKPYPHTDGCSVAITGTPMDPYNVFLLAVIPCLPVERVLGAEYRSNELGDEYRLSVETDFEFDADGNGGSYRTKWESTSFYGTQQVVALRFVDFDGEYLSGQIDAVVHANMRNGAILDQDPPTVPFTASFRARVEEWTHTR